MRVITGTARGTVLHTPKGMQTRPTMDQVKEGLFSAIQFEVEGRRVLDLFAGSGQLGIEALSRGAERAVFIDASLEACAAVRQNLEKTRLAARAQIIQADYLRYLSCCHETFDLIFLDPPYAEVFLENALKKISEIDILSDSGIIICEKPAEKRLADIFAGIERWREYRYGKTSVTLLRKRTGASEEV